MATVFIKIYFMQVRSYWLCWFVHFAFSSTLAYLAPVKYTVYITRLSLFYGP